MKEEEKSKKWRDGKVGRSGRGKEKIMRPEREEGKRGSGRKKISKAK